MEVGPDGSIYIADTGNQRIRRVRNGIIATIAGTGQTAFAGDGGPGFRANLDRPTDLAIGPDRQLYILDNGAARIRRQDLVTGFITTVAGNGEHTVSGDGGNPLQAGLGDIRGIAIDARNNLYILENSSARIRVVHAVADAGNTVVPRLAIEPTIIAPPSGDPLAGTPTPPSDPARRASGDGGVYRAGNGVTSPTLLFKPDPEYSDEARRAKFEGDVTLYLVVGVDGHPTDIRVVSGLGAGLDEKAMEAVSRWRFQPGTKDGQPVKIMATVNVNFRLLGLIWTTTRLKYQIAANVTRPTITQTSFPPPCGKSGTMTLALQIAADGAPAGISVVRSTNESLNEDAIAAIQKWRFTPAQQNGVPLAAGAELDLSCKSASAR